MHQNIYYDKLLVTVMYGLVRYGYVKVRLGYVLSSCFKAVLIISCAALKQLLIIDYAWDGNIENVGTFQAHIIIKDLSSFYLVAKDYF